VIARTAPGGGVTPPAKSQRAGSGSQVPEVSAPPLSAVAPDGVAFGGTVRCVGKRVDALVVAFRLGIPSAVSDEIAERQSLADETGAAALRLGEFTFALKRARSRSRVSFQNGDVRGVFDPEASGRFLLEVTVRATFLATHPLEQAVELCTQVAAAFGTVAHARLRRFDLRSHDAECVLTTRARLESFRGVEGPRRSGCGGRSSPEGAQERCRASYGPHSCSWQPADGARLCEMRGAALAGSRGEARH
jgi:hypothetical protein